MNLPLRANSHPGEVVKLKVLSTGQWALQDSPALIPPPAGARITHRLYVTQADRPTLSQQQ